VTVSALEAPLETATPGCRYLCVEAAKIGCRYLLRLPLPLTIRQRLSAPLSCEPLSPPLSPLLPLPPPCVEVQLTGDREAWLVWVGGRAVWVGGGGRQGA